MRVDQIPPGLRRLDPERRALLELSFRRGVSDDDIGELLGVAPAEVHRRREEGVERLSEVLALERAEERQQLAEGLRAMPNDAWGAPSGDDPRRMRLVVAIAFATAALAAGGLALAVTAGEDDSASLPAAANSEATPAGDRAAAVPREVRLRPVAGGRGAGTAQLREDGERLLLSVRGLQPPGGGIYVVWLYRAVDDAVPIGGSARTSFGLDARLPGNAARYTALDISLEPRDGNDAHAGDSVLRAPLGPLREG